MELVAVVMAGGRGERFWPLSRGSMPKQFLSLNGDSSMIQQAVARIRSLVTPEDTFIVTGADYVPKIRAQVSEVPAENIIVEPEGRDTAPCIALAAIAVSRAIGGTARHNDPVMLVLPADHHIEDAPAFLRVLRAAAELADSGEVLVTIGIKPTRPETGYGYIELGEPLQIGKPPGEVRKAISFKEKPDARTARGYISTEKFVWNSGIFAWKSSVIWNQISVHLPALHKCMERIRLSWNTPWRHEVLDREFPLAPRISIDYGVMEKATNVLVLPGEFGWDDMGTWSALNRVLPADAHGNVIVSGNAVMWDCRGCVVHGGSRLVAAVGVEDIIVVDAGDAVLVCKKRDEAKIKELLAELRRRGLERYL